MSDERAWRILLIDDDEDDYKITQDMLRKFQGRKAELDWAPSFEEGVQKLTMDSYDSVLVDYDLGPQTGIELIQQFTAREHPTPIILYTGRGTYAVDVEAMQAGVTLYLSKTEATPLLLERSIRYAIERKQIENQLRQSNDLLMESNRKLAQELAERRRAEVAISHLNRTLRAVSNSTQALMRATNEISLLTEVCQIVVRDCGHPLVWIGFAENDAYKTVRPVAHFGFDLAYIQAMNITWDDVPFGRGPTGTAIRTGRPSLIRDMRTDPSFEPWRERAISRGYASCIALPLIQDGHAFGVLNIYSRRTDAFSQEEVDLLTELSSDLAFGVTAIRLRQANAIAEEKQRYLASFPEENPAPVTEVHLDGAIYYANPTALRLFPDLIKAKKSHPWLANWETVVEHFQKSPGELLVRSITIQGMFYQQNIVYIPDSHLIRIYASDITDRIHAEHALRQSEERFRIALQNMPVTVANLDRDLRYTWIYNPLEGFKADEVLGKTIGYSADPETQRITHTHLRKLIRTGTSAHWENTFQAKTGQVTLETYAEPVRDANGEIVGAALVSIDITQRRRIELAINEQNERLKRYARQLERSNQALEDFTFVASHDLQEPLRKVRAFGDLLKSRHSQDLDPDAQNYIDRMQHATTRMQALLDGLLAFSRVTTQANPFSTVDLYQLIAEVLIDLEWKISQTGCSVDIGEMPTLQADPLQMQQLFQNLIGNALKFYRLDTAPVIKIESQAISSTHVTITVEDNGIGFDEQLAHRIFHPFIRLNPKAEYEGAGMGLAICYKIIERHNGSITVRSTPGSGTIFTITLPVTQQESYVI